MRCSRFFAPRIFAVCCLAPWWIDAAAIAGEAVSLQRTLESSGSRVVPLRRTEDNHLYLTGRVNGRRSSILVDTGTPFTAISTNMARSTERDCTIAQLTLGDITLTNQPALVQDIRYDGQTAPFDIVLGVDFLRRHAAIIDCGKRRLYLPSQSADLTTQPAIVSILHQAGFTSLELASKHPPALTCGARVNGQPVELLVDSGAALSCLDTRQIERLGLKPKPTLRTIVGADNVGKRAIIAAQAHRFTLGDTTMRDVKFAVLDLKDWGLAAPGESLGEVHGILGGGELATLNAVIDCGSLKLWLKSPGQKR